MRKIDSRDTWYKEAIKQRDRDWSVKTALDKAEKSERNANFSIGFSIFTLLFILFVELVIANKQ